MLFSSDCDFRTLIFFCQYIFLLGQVVVGYNASEKHLRGNRDVQIGC